MCVAWSHRCDVRDAPWLHSTVWSCHWRTSLRMSSIEYSGYWEGLFMVTLLFVCYAIGWLLVHGDEGEIGIDRDRGAGLAVLGKSQASGNATKQRQKPHSSFCCKLTWFVHITWILLSPLSPVYCNKECLACEGGWGGGCALCVPRAKATQFGRPSNEKLKP